jgi:hypothetical protein
MSVEQHRKGLYQAVATVFCARFFHFLVQLNIRWRLLLALG